MSNADKLVDVFACSLGLEREKIIDELEYNSIVEWDSVAHMALVAELESAFEIMLDTDDIIDMSSVKQARTILAKYDVEF